MMAHRKIVVMGGSFNPPTIAHLKLMERVLSHLTLRTPDVYAKGIFVPSSDAYVSRKIERLTSGNGQEALSEKLRFDMLQSFHHLNSRLTVDGRELGTNDVRGHTIDTLREIQQENPDSDIFFIFGGDKIQNLSRWKSYTTMVKEFKIIVFRREGDDPQQIIHDDPMLSEYSDSFVVLDPPEGIDGISSTDVRERVSRGLNVQDLLTQEVYTMYLAEKNKVENKILCFQGDYFFLSNFYVGLSFFWNPFPYTNAEAAFQSAKCQSSDDQYSFCMKSPREARKMGQHVVLRPDWEDVKDSIMKNIIHEKFFQDEQLARKLMATGDAELIEGNTWGDTYWGVDLHTMKGQNRLGRILMDVRQELNDIPSDKFGFRVKSYYVDAWSNDDIMDMVVESWKRKAEEKDRVKTTK